MKMCVCFCLFSGALIAEPTCALCEKHREYNKEHPGDYEYYEDYLEAQKKAEKK